VIKQDKEFEVSEKFTNKNKPTKISILQNNNERNFGAKNELIRKVGRIRPESGR
jgi:hypothetical protein